MAKMALNINNTCVTLDESHQEEVYNFYRTHCVIERLNDYIEENDLDIQFKSYDNNKTVANKVLSIMDDYHVSEDEAIKTVFNDKDYINQFIF